MFARSLRAAVVAALLAFFLVYCLQTLATTAPTFDEGAHLPAGYLQLELGEIIINPEHPPLAKLLAAMPLAMTLGHAMVDELKRSPGDQWQLGRVLLNAGGREWAHVLNPARMVTVLFGLVLCVACGAWAYQLAGWTAGLLSLGLCVFCPNILAHSRLVTTDIPVAACAVVASLLAWQMTMKPSLGRAVLWGLALGATITTKFSGILFGGALVTLVLWSLSRRTFKMSGSSPQGDNTEEQGNTGGNNQERTQPFLRVVYLVVIAVLVACGCIPLVYESWDGFSQYLHGVQMLGHNHQPTFKIFLFGRYREEGFWWYFPAAFLVKSSPAILAGILIAFVSRWALPSRQNGTRYLTPKWGHTSSAAWFVIIPMVTYGVFIVFGAPQFGIRYLLPCLPFLFVLLGIALAPLARVRFGRLLLAGLLATHGAAAMLSFPDPISYFNGLFGCSGPEAVRCLDDSNFDWGQDLGRAAEYVRALDKVEGPVRLLYFGTADPDAFFQQWSVMEPEEFLRPYRSIYVVSLQMLQRFTVLGGLPEKLRWENRFSPAAYIGNTYVVYDFRSG